MVSGLKKYLSICIVCVLRPDIFIAVGIKVLQNVFLIRTEPIMCRVYQNTKDTSTQNEFHDAHTLAMFSLAAVLIRFFHIPTSV